MRRPSRSKKQARIGGNAFGVGWGVVMVDASGVDSGVGMVDASGGANSYGAFGMV